MKGEHSLETIERLISNYANVGGIVHEVGDNGVGLGTVILYNNGLEISNFVIKEIYLNEWSSTHTVRRYKELPKKYLDMLEDATDGKEF